MCDRDGGVGGPDSEAEIAGLQRTSSSLLEASRDRPSDEDFALKLEARQGWVNKSSNYDII